MSVNGRMGKKNGQGTLTYPDGGKYVGEWKNGKKNGQGTFTDPYGNKYEGEYENGKYWNGLFFNKNGHITGNIVNGNFNQ